MEKKEPTLREVISRGKDVRFEEELTRPRVEIWPDEWAQWMNSHKKDNKAFMYCYTEGRASPLCPMGLH